MTLDLLFTTTFGNAPLSKTLIEGSASSRRYFRMRQSETATVIGVETSNLAEAETFVYLTGHFGQRGIPVPKIIAMAADKSCYILEDAGEKSLLQNLTPQLLDGAIDLLLNLQQQGQIGLDWGKTYGVKAFSKRDIRWDLNYFKYCFLMNVSDSDTIDASRLQDEFDKLEQQLIDYSESETGFLHRDYQCRNILVDDKNGNALTVIDYQGGRRGPVYYDLATFLWHGRTALSPIERKHLAQRYFDRYGQGLPPIDLFYRRLTRFALFRQLQVLGAYGYRGLTQRKPNFIAPITTALKGLMSMPQWLKDEYPYIFESLGAVHPPLVANTPQGKHLTVAVTSFSFKKGYPYDMGGNGGGFVFDCRALPNPGRFDRYKPLTGLDSEVMDFLDDKPAVSSFIEQSIHLASQSIDDYIKRGFTSLSISYGCTGGRHRSVYCAQHAAEQLQRLYPAVKIELIHREQGIKRTLQ